MSVAPINCELLCFMQNKSKLMTFDDIVKICCDFYTLDEIVNAHGILAKFVEHRLPKHRGSDKEKARNTVSDLLKCVLDPEVSLPQFCCVDLSRLPPVSADHVDITAIWQELIQLRSEVREVAALRKELAGMKTVLSDFQKSDFPPLGQGVTREGPLPAFSVFSRDTTAAQMYVNRVDTAGVVREAIKSGAIEKQKVRKKPVVGTKTSNSRVKPVVTQRCVDVFISRLHPGTSSEDMEACTKEALNIADFDMSQVRIVCENLPGKYDFYTSYHVAVTVNSDSFARAIDILMSSDSWPAGLLVRRFFPKRERNDSQ